MNRIDEQEETDDSAIFPMGESSSVDQFPSVQSSSSRNRSSICSSKQTSNQTDRSKYQINDRPSSLPPARHSSSSSSSFSNEQGVKQRRRYASDSQTSNQPTLLVTSFLQYLRHQLRTTTSDKKNDYHRHTRQKSSSGSPSIIMNSKLSPENILELNDQNEILTLIDLLVLRVECLTNETKKKKKSKDAYPTVAEVDHNLIEYLYYLFTKFTRDDINDLPTPMIDKNNFVNVCQTLVRNGCFEIPSSSPDQSISEMTISSSDQTLTAETVLHEYHPEIDPMITDKSSADEQDAWLVVDLEPIPSENYELDVERKDSCFLPTSSSDEQLLLSTNDNDKSYESFSSPSIYLSPNSSLIDIQNLALELDETNHQDGSTLNVSSELKTTTTTTTTSNDDTHSSTLSNTDIYSGLTNDENSIEYSEQMVIDESERMSQRERKMQERWALSTKTDGNNGEQLSNKSLLGIDFPPISVLRRKFSSASSANKKKNNTDEEINTLPMTMIVDNTNPDQINELLSKDLSILTNTEVGKSNDDKQLLVEEEETTTTTMIKTKQDPLSSPIECQTETITNINNELVDDEQTNHENSSTMLTNPMDSNIFSTSIVSSPPPPPSLISISPSSSSLTLTTNENDTFEPLVKETKKEEERREEQRSNDDDNLDEEKKNNSSFVYDYHASGILLINDEPTPTALLGQEKKEEKEEEEEERERASSSLPTLEQSNQERTEDESSLQTLSNDFNPSTMTTTNDNEERFNKIEVEELPDDEEAISTQNIESIEPTDYIHTDEEPRKKSTPSNLITLEDQPIKFDTVFSCYEKALAKVVDTPLEELSTTTEQSAEDPIALRALQRFEQRMNAAVAATKSTKDEPTFLAAKGKSSWSGSISTPRKSLENLLKTTEQQELRPISVSTTEESSSPTSISQSDSYIRPRKTFDDNLNYGTTLDLHPPITEQNNNNNNNDHHHRPNSEEQLQPSAIVETDDKRVVENNSLMMMMTESNDQSPDIVDDQTVTVVEQPTITPYRFQLEGRRRLNTLERMRERRQSRESFETTDEKQQQIQNEYTLKPEEVQDPIIRRALERFDEKNRALTQTKSMNYDDIQDPITRRALMRLESNLKRTMPATTTPTSNESWYTENYTLGSLQSGSERPSRYTESSPQSPKTKYISVHQHYCTPSSNDLADASVANQNNDSDKSVVRAPTQPIYLTSTNQPLSLRQRSRSEDMLSSRDLTIGQTTNLDDVDTSAQLQRNRSSNEIALHEPNSLLPNTLIKALEPTFVRTTESSVSYVTPTQTYSAYSCEYTRPRRNPVATPSETPSIYKQETNPLPTPKYSQPTNDIQRPTPYRLTQTSSADVPPMQPSTATTTTSNYYGQQPISTPSYGSMYTSNNVSQTPYSEDPIVRRALERFNSQMQSSYSSTLPYQPASNYLSRQGNLPDPYLTSNRPTLMTTSTSSTNSGYQSIIGRRRQTRYDDPNTYFVDNPSVGDGYSSSLFVNAQNPYPASSHYMNMSDEPPAIPPRYRRNEDSMDHYRRHSTDEYLSDNLNNNNNNSHTLPRDAFIHHAYPATITNAAGFRPINTHYNPLSSEHDEFHDRAQSTSSTTSSDSFKQQQQQQRLNHLRHEQRLPPSSFNGRKTNEQITGNTLSPDHSPSDQTSSTGDSVFHRLAYTGTKASLSRSSSNSCSNLLNKNTPQNPTNQLKSCEIDFDDTPNTTIIDHTNEPISNPSSNTKYQRSKSVDTRTRLKLAQARTNNDPDENNLLVSHDDQQRTIPSSKFTPVNSRPPPRAPLTPRTSLTKRSSNGVRTPNSNGNYYETDTQQQDFENDENISMNDDNYPPKSLDNRTRTTIPVQRYHTNIQPSTSTSSVSSNLSRTKPPVSTPINLDRRDSNGSMADTNRTSRRLDDNRLVSPTGQRRNIPVSVFSPAKLDNKRPAPAPPIYTYESQQPSSYLARLSSHDQSYPTKSIEPELNIKSSSSGVKTPTGSLLNEYPHTTDKHDNTKKMNVFERLFRGNKKKN